MTTSAEPATPVVRPTAPMRLDRATVRVLVWPAVLLVAVLGVLLFFVEDLSFDIRTGVPASHVTVELAAVGLAIVGVIGTIVQFRAALLHARALQSDLTSTREDAERWRSEAEALARRVGLAVEHYFVEWGLTSAEKEIALLVLRGLSYKEVAQVRGTAERTVRHQALAIYRKAGVSGRAEMAAVFLQDVLAGVGAASDGPKPSETPVPSITRSTLVF